MNPTVIESKFNIFDTGRKYTGQQRGYILENIQKVFDSDVVQERLKLRQMFGYFGHTFREKSGKMELAAKDVLKMPSGQETIVDTIPACVTVKLEIDAEGNVEHHQEILDNDEGKKIMGLHNSKVGGFSWAALGGSKGGRTILNDLFGFDYDPRPLFVTNKGYVLDDASSDILGREDIISNLLEQGIEDGGQVLDSFYATMEIGLDSAREEVLSLEQKTFELEQQVLDNADHASDLESENKRLEKALFDANEIIKSEEAAAQQILDDAQEMENSHKEKWRKSVTDFSDKSVIGIPTPILDSLLAGDFNAYQEFILDASANIDINSLPIKRESIEVPKQNWGKDKADNYSPSFGEGDITLG